VHNGIIENYAEIRRAAGKAGRTFASETDTEVIAGLLDSELAKASHPSKPQGDAGQLIGPTRWPCW
jgi:glucosamine--fructose-6-phosphate aminotransferase (isomerizing)